MAEDLEPSDVEAFTRGAVAADDPETARALNAALARARRHCNWHVSPVQTETVVLQGKGLPFVVLPTLRPQLIISVTENGVDVDLDSIRLDGIMLRKASGWHGTVEVQLTHGYPADEAYDFREAVLMLADQSLASERGEGVVEKQVDDVRVKWAPEGIGPEIQSRLAPYVRHPWYVG